jgi:hypothetical protein
MKYALASGLFSACLLVTACSEHAGNHSGGAHVLNGSVQLGNGQITLHTWNAPVATISVNGDFQVGQQAVSTTPAVRDLLKSYYANIQLIRADSVATDQAGNAMGGHIAQAIKTQLDNGHPEQIGSAIEVQTKPLVQAALKICQDMSVVKATQDQLIDQLPAFKPYGNIVGTNDISDCKSDIHAP